MNQTLKNPLNQTLKNALVSALCALILLTVFLPGRQTVKAADILVLKNGGRLQGQFLVPPGGEDLVYKFRTAEGIEIQIARSEVESVEKMATLSAAEEYEKQKAAATDDVEGNLALAQWCAENGMYNQKKAHYERVLELDPENEIARRGLGFKRMIDGQWRTSNDEMEEQGKVKYNGRWISTQEKELLEKQKAEKIKTSKMASDIKKWVKKIGTRAEGDALAELTSLRDPMAVPGILQVYETEKRPPVRKLLIKCLGRIGNQAALTALLQISVDEKIEELRLSALDEVKPHKGPGVTEYYIARLSPKKSTHEQLNYAAYALGALEDSSAVPALIQALETTHKFQVQTGNSNGQTSVGAGRSSSGGGGMGFGVGGKTITISKPMQNPEVLESLKKLTGMNFYYDQQQWIRWYQQQTGGAGASIRPEK
ncbi:MAG: HEAT repeat domain-containing protein [Thermoguttaceae bacterium]|nr:HEAT repeat domain-containing protein [Thermoguttaceae bacterium]